MAKVRDLLDDGGCVFALLKLLLGLSLHNQWRPTAGLKFII